MTTRKPSVPVALRTIENAILQLRGHRVMLDETLAPLYGVEVKVLNQAVKRNLDRFPEDFMFQLSRDELRNLRSQSVTSRSDAIRELMTPPERPRRAIGFREKDP